MDLNFLRALKNSQQGKRVLILGNAKSLLDIPLEKVSIDTFAMNRIAPIFKSTSWRPTWYICGTLRIGWNKSYKSDFYTAVNQSIFSFLGTRIQHLVEKELIYSNFSWVKFLDVADKKIEPPKTEYWNRDTSQGEVSIYGHTGFGAIQLARYLGYEEIILGGMDIPYAVPESRLIDTNHFYPEYETKNLMPEDEQYEIYNTNLIMSHSFTSDMADIEGIKISSLETNKGLTKYRRMKINELI